MAKGKLVLIIGPSGVGKSVILKELKAKHAEWHFPRSATTRQRRKGEGDDLYQFVTDTEFDQMVSDGHILESAIVHEGARYGTLVDEIIPFIKEGKIVVREVDVQGFDAIRNHQLFSGEDSEYQLQSIFIMPENVDQLILRIKKRAPIDDEELERRVASVEEEMKYAELCDHQIVNADGGLEEAIKKVEESIMRL